MKDMKKTMQRKLLSPDKHANSDRDDSGLDSNTAGTTNLLKDVMKNIAKVKAKEQNQSLTPLVEEDIESSHSFLPAVTKKNPKP